MVNSGSASRSLSDSVGGVSYRWLLTLWVLAVSLWAGTLIFPQGAAPATARAAVADYAIGPGDILTITVSDAPELSGKFRVTETGFLALPSLSSPIKAEGLTALNLSKSIADAIKTAELLREPVVNVFVEEYHSRTVTVLGSVAKPSVYPLQKPTTLLEVLSMAGGLTPAAGSTVTIVRKSLPAGLEGVTQDDLALLKPDSSMTIDLTRLMLGQDPSLNVEVQPGDAVSVATAPVIYVVGAVNKPGGFAVQDPSAGLTVLQALGLAEGLKSTAAGKKGLIIRNSQTTKERQEIPIDLGKLMEQKIPDQQLASNDILFVPESGTRKNLKALATAGQQAINGIAIYGIGYRIAGRR